MSDIVDLNAAVSCFVRRETALRLSAVAYSA